MEKLEFSGTVSVGVSSMGFVTVSFVLSVEETGNSVSAIAVVSTAVDSCIVSARPEGSALSDLEEHAESGHSNKIAIAAQRGRPFLLQFFGLNRKNSPDKSRNRIVNKI